MGEISEVVGLLSSLVGKSPQVTRFFVGVEVAWAGESLKCLGSGVGC